jgi:ParB family chromosome partitioning protein
MDDNDNVIRMISIDRIRILNPRSRNSKIFAGMVDNISTVGLKRPITVRENGADNDGARYDLVCGQGRIEAFQAMGESEIPALVIQATESECYLRSLIENMARRKHSNRDLLMAIRVMEERGYSPTEIASKTGLNKVYVDGILVLLNNGEDRLIAAVERGWMPMYLATQIAHSDDTALQNTLQEAYQEGILKGTQLLKVRRLIERRRLMGTGYGRSLASKGQPTTSTRSLVRAYQEEVRRQEVLIRKAEIGEQRLLLLTTALRQLLSDEHFRTLLRAEGLDDLPKVVANQMKSAP